MNNSDYYFNDIGDTFAFGRHRRQLLCDVLADDPTYLDWCVNNIPNFRTSEQTLEQIKLLFPHFTITETFMQHVGEKLKSYEAFYDSDYSDWEDYDYEDGSATCQRYSGSYAQDEMGYSDNDIDTIFDGEPGAYWNID